MMNFPKIIIFNLIKGFSILLIATSTLYADTNTFDDSSSLYNIGDIVSIEGEFQAEVLENNKDSIEIGLFNQEGLMTAMLIWDDKAKSANVILNPSTEDEKSLPVQISEHMSSENGMKTLADGLLVIATAQEPEPLSPEKSKLSATSANNISVTRAAPLPVIITKGHMTDGDSGLHDNPLVDNHTEGLFGRLVSYTRVSGGSDNRPAWVRFMVYNHPLSKWDVMGWLKVEPLLTYFGISTYFRYTIPEPYDLDRTGNDLRIAQKDYDYAFLPQGLAFANVRYPVYTMKYAADAWSGPGKKRTTFMQKTVTRHDYPY